MNSAMFMPDYANVKNFWYKFNAPTLSRGKFVTLSYRDYRQINFDKKERKIF